MEKRQVELF